MPASPKIPTLSVPLDEARAPFVLGVDVGSTASRGGLYSACGRPIKGSKQRIAHEFTTDEHGASTMDADQVVRECREVIEKIAEFAQDKSLEIAAVAMDSFASSLVVVDEGYRPLTPLMTYADSRSAKHVERLRARIDEQAYQSRTGVRLHTSYHPARLAWLNEQHPDIMGKAHRVFTVGEYVYQQLAGLEGLATSSAAWAGIIDARTGELDHEILRETGTSADVIAPIVEPDQPLYPTEAVADLAGIPWFPAIPDGWSSNVGPGATDAHTVAVAAATSGAMRVILPRCPETIPAGLWCYRLSARQWILGGALNDVGRAITWLENTIAPVEAAELEEQLRALPNENTPSSLPFFSGERATGWASSAQAAITGITAATKPVDLWRSVIEALSLSYRRIWDELLRSGATPRRVVASGRVTTDHPAWLVSLADALATPIVPINMKRATLRGTALIALDVIDPDGERHPAPHGEAVEPREEARGFMDRALEKFGHLYQKLV
ncbi:gluconokinase [Corynebacterium tapiri]|uniref:Gluconate kinase n=1 Tax=Corynebacterium tapiri TaxID=1448266 RepID=A0A5C4U1C4_9CORY|nr:gluconokinase [Corynebacterium tapiri]TNL95359.1 gluconate kinase [Corynebacterium tapiri]